MNFRRINITIRWNATDCFLSFNITENDLWKQLVQDINLMCATYCSTSNVMCCHSTGHMEIQLQKNDIDIKFNLVFTLEGMYTLIHLQF